MINKETSYFHCNSLNGYMVFGDQQDASKIDITDS